MSSPDERYLFPFEKRLNLYKETLGDSDSDPSEDTAELIEGSEDHPYNVVSSLCVDGKHRPALDIDMPVVLVPSSTEGHCHLYFPQLALSWAEYEALLTALAEAGIISKRYLAFSVNRQQTLLRPPHVRKPPR